MFAFREFASYSWSGNTRGGAPVYKNHQKGQKAFGPKEQEVFESVSEGNKYPDLYIFQKLSGHSSIVMTRSKNIIIIIGVLKLQIK